MTGKGRGHPENRGVEVAGLVAGLTELKLGDGRRKERESNTPIKKMRERELRRNWREN